MGFYDLRNKYRLLLWVVIIRVRGCVLRFLCITDMKVSSEGHNEG